MTAPLEPTIGEHGLIGDTRTAALVTRDGSIDWLCAPRFDSDPLFGRLVGGPEAGSFDVRVEEIAGTRRRYLPRSSVLETTWVTRTGEAVLTEGMVADTAGRLLPQLVLVRALTCRSGDVSGRVLFDPRRAWRAAPEHAERRHGRLVCTWGPLVATLASDPDLELVPGEPASFELRAGHSLVLVLGVDHREPAVLVEPRLALPELHRSDAWWRAWSSGLGPPEIGDGLDEVVRRSLITLRLLTFAPSGAPVAAPTTSLPEVPGGDRNWDYRYAWIRDAAMGTSAFLRAGSTAEPRAFLWWMLHASRRTRPELRVVYDVLGSTDLAERVLPELAGYGGARPVRVGNAAVDQFQLDAYAWMLDAGWSYHRSTGDLYAETWRALRGHADLLAERWRDPDHGIWEVRGEPRPYVHSKVMAWIGLDRALRLAERLPARGGGARRWLDARERIGREVRARGFDPLVGSYTEAYGSRELDAAVLQLTRSTIEPPGSPRVTSSIAAIRERLGAGGPLLYRSRPRGEGAFLPCSFWLARALAATGSVDEARGVFEAACSLGTELGLFAEQIDPGTLEHIGNFPQAFTHAALVEAAAELARAESLRARGTLRGSLRT